MFIATLSSYVVFILSPWKQIDLGNEVEIQAQEHVNLLTTVCG